MICQKCNKDSDDVVVHSDGITICRKCEVKAAVESGFNTIHTDKEKYNATSNQTPKPDESKRPASD